MNLPARIRRMSKRRQKPAIAKLIEQNYASGRYSCLGHQPADVKVLRVRIDKRGFHYADVEFRPAVPVQHVSFNAVIIEPQGTKGR